jgi:SNF2 family DNA or RNA helicase
VPASLKLNWRNEILKFTNEKCFIFKFKPRKKDNIITYTKDESLFHIINYESLESYFDFNYSHKCTNYNRKWEGVTEVKKYDKCPNCGRMKVVKSRTYHLINKEDKDGELLNPNNYELIVLDEAHYIKNPTAFRSQIIKKAFKESSKKILMTGTAIKNRPYEFFPLLNLIDSKEWSNAHNFGVRYCNAHQDKFGHWNYDGYSNLEELYRRISPYFLRRLKKDILKFLPPKTYTTIPIELKSDSLKEYKKIEDGVVDEAQEGDDKMTHLARIQKLKQLTSMFKAKQSIEFIENIIEGDEKIVVFSQFISASEFIYQHFKDVAVWFTGKHNMIEKQQSVDRFMNDDSCKVFVGTIGAAGVGLTLTSASCLMFLDLPWEPASKIQAEDRIHRASQKSDNIQIIKLICQNTIDVDIDNLITEKEQIISKVLDGEIIENKNEFSIFDDLLKIILDKKNN